jgi:hypothetical protein
MESAMTRLPLFVAPRLQRGVFERFVTGKVDITNEPVGIETCHLDKRGKDRFEECRAKMDVETIIGISRFRWKSAEDREKCIAEQKSKNKRGTCGESRWTDVLAIVDAINQNVDLPLPALVHPDLCDHEGLWVIDGSRRFVAYVEAGIEEFRVVVVRPASGSSS